MKMINFTNTCKKKIYIIRDENDLCSFVNVSIESHILHLDFDLNFKKKENIYMHELKFN